MIFFFLADFINCESPPLVKFGSPLSFNWSSLLVVLYNEVTKLKSLPNVSSETVAVTTF